MAKRKLKVVAHRLFSTMISLLVHGRSSSSCSRPANNKAAPSSRPAPVRRDGCPPPPTLSSTSTLVVDVDTALLLRRSGYFPYYMLVALEAGGLLRGLLLLLLYPVFLLLPATASTAAMAFVSFCGLRAARFRAGRAVLPKWFMDDVAAEAFQAAGFRASNSNGRVVVCVSGAMPRVMLDGFLREYLGADAVVAREMSTLCGFYTGLIFQADAAGHHDLLTSTDTAVGFSGSPEFLNHPLAHSSCKEVYVVSPEEKRRWRALPRDKYPKPVVFHDGRLAFRPTAANTLAMFAWLPFGVALGAARLAVALTVPYRYSTPVLAATGMSWRLKGDRPPLLPSTSSSGNASRGQLFVCNHRTLIDPVYVSVALDRQVRAVSYSLSRLSELISPIGRTVRLTRDRRSDGRVMATLLAEGDLVVVCPEGTTCREPYLLRFSPLFAELADDVVPVGIAVETSAFYATTAGGLKCFDPLYYMVNPRMCYTVQFLDRVDTKAVKEGSAPSTDVANRVQRNMGDALGYACTMLTRKDKYLMLAGNDGIVVSNTSVNKTTPSATTDDEGKNKIIKSN